MSFFLFFVVLKNSATVAVFKHSATVVVAAINHYASFLLYRFDDSENFVFSH